MLSGPKKKSPGSSICIPIAQISQGLMAINWGIPIPIAKSLHLEGGEITRTSNVKDVAGIHQRFSSGLSKIEIWWQNSHQNTGPRSGFWRWLSFSIGGTVFSVIEKDPGGLGFSVHKKNPAEIQSLVPHVSTLRLEVFLCLSWMCEVDP